MTIAPKLGAWQPPESVSREDTIARSDVVLAMPDLPLRETEDIFRIHALGLDWDLGVTVYEPADPARLARGADGKTIGIFLLHGGSGDYKSMEPMAKLFAEKFKSKTRDEWAAIFDGTDACTTPVLTFAEAEQNPHIVARTGLIEIDGVVQHAPAPRFSRTPSGTPTPPPTVATPIESVWAD